MIKDLIISSYSKNIKYVYLVFIYLFIITLEANASGINSAIIGTKKTQYLNASFDVELPFKSDAKEPKGDFKVVRTVEILDYNELLKETKYKITLDSIVSCNQMGVYPICTSIADPSVILPPQIGSLKDMIGKPNFITLDSALNVISQTDTMATAICLLMLHTKNINNLNSFEQSTQLPIPGMPMEVTTNFEKVNETGGLLNYKVNTKGENISAKQQMLVDPLSHLIQKNDLVGEFKYMFFKIKIKANYTSQ
jgi:hypothetical protein